VTAPTILWEGATALAVDKPSGMLVHNSAFAGPRERSLRQAVGAELARRVYPVHRVDRGTSGVVLFARETAYVPAWQAALASERAGKMYLAVVRGRLSIERDIDAPLRSEGDGQAKIARTLVLPLGVSNVARCSLVAVGIATGRQHQIRRHLDSVGHPVVNDATHGDSRFNRDVRSWVGDRLMLHAWSICVPSPEALASEAQRFDESARGDAQARRDASGSELVIEAPPRFALAATLSALFGPVDVAHLRSARDRICAWRSSIPMGADDGFDDTLVR